MMEKTPAMRLLAIFMFCSLFSIKTGKCQLVTGTYDEPGEKQEITTESNEVLGEIKEGEPTEKKSEDITIDKEDVTIGEEEGPTVETKVTEEKAAVSAPERKKRKVAATRPTKQVKKSAGRRVSKKPVTGVTRKGAVKTGAIPGKASKHKFVAKGENEIEKLAQFNEDGNLESFNEAVDKLVNYIKDQKKLSAEEKSHLYVTLAKFTFKLGSAEFEEDGHYEAVAKLLTAAKDNSKLFSRFQAKKITEWQINVEKAKADPKLRKQLTRKPEAGDKGRRKQPRKKDISKAKYGEKTVRKAPRSARSYRD